MITVLVFAHLREKFGQPRFVLEESGLTVGELRRLLAERYDVTDMDSIMVAINEEFAEDDERVSSGDTVALIPPVSGG